MSGKSQVIVPSILLGCALMIGAQELLKTLSHERFGKTPVSAKEKIVSNSDSPVSGVDAAMLSREKAISDLQADIRKALRAPMPKVSKSRRSSNVAARTVAVRGSGRSLAAVRPQVQYQQPQYQAQPGGSSQTSGGNSGSGGSSSGHGGGSGDHGDDDSGREFEHEDEHEFEHEDEHEDEHEEEHEDYDD